MNKIFKRTYSRVKKPQHINKNIFVIFMPKRINIEPATSYELDTEIILILPQGSHGFVTSKFRSDEIHRINAKKQHLWIEILNKSFEKNLVVEKNSAIGLVIIEPDNLPHKLRQKRTKIKRTKHRMKNKTRKQKNKHQNGGFLNRYDFAYVGRNSKSRC